MGVMVRSWDQVVNSGAAFAWKRFMRSAVSIVVPTIAVLLTGAGLAGAQNPNVVLNQITLLGGFPNGGAFGSGTAAGTSMAVNSAGQVFLATSYGGSLAEFDGTTGVETTLGSYSNIGPVAVDQTNNLYIANVYAAMIVKLPYSNGAYATFSTPSSSTPVCSGTDTAECTLASTAVSGPYGVASMTFDTKGNLFYSSTNGGSAGNAIFEIPAGQLTTSAPAPTMIYQEPASSTAPILVGGMALDPSGNLFFADAVFTDQSNEVSSSSYVNELLYLGADATYSPTKTVLYTYTVATPANYDNLITSVAVKADGSTLYFADENDGIFGFPLSQGVVNTSTLYTFSTQGAKVMTSDGAGNFYVSAYSNSTKGDALSHVAVDVLTAPQTNLGSSGTATNVSTILNDVTNCSSTTVTYAADENGAATTEFSAATSGSCSTVSFSNASAIPTTVTFTPTQPGPRSGTITATDANAGSGSAMVSGLAVGSPAATPAFTPAAGTYTSIQSVTITDATANSTIYYTTDGSAPTTSSNVYTGPISVATTETISAIAVANGSANSAVGTSAYTINLPPAATPVFTPGPGTYTTIQSVTISDATANSTIYYTTDGSTPTTSSTVYTGPITVSANETINAVAAATGSGNSAVANATYTINLPPAATPVFMPGSGTYTTIQSVTITDGTPGSTIYYTTDGSTPTSSSAVYSGPITVSATETINAIASATGNNTSAVGTATFTITLPAGTPVISPQAGTFNAVQMVMLTDTTTGATIYYTTDGSTPTTSSTVYTAPIMVGVSQTIKAIAIAPGFISSGIASAVYTINLPTFGISINPGAMTIAASGGEALANVTVTPMNTFEAPVTFACSGLPTGVTCTFTPAVVTPNGAVPVTTVLALTSGGTTAALERSPRPFLPATLAFAACLIGWKRRRSLKMLTTVFAATLCFGLLSGCSGTTNSSPTATTATVTVTATSGALVQSGTLTLTVN